MISSDEGDAFDHRQVADVPPERTKLSSFLHQSNDVLFGLCGLGQHSINP